MSADDKTIRENVDAAKAGDEKAFARLITMAKNTVTSIALTIVKDIDNSEEVAQRVFIAAWHNLKSLNNNDSFLPWIRQTTRYQAFNFLRDNKVNRQVSGEQADQLLAGFCDPDLANDQVLEREQQSIILADFISDLPEESREIVLLYYREEQSSKQVATLLELSEANVRKKLSRVRAILKQQLLQKYGRLILSTAPTLGFTSIVLSALTTSSPVAAAALATSASSGKVSLASKLLGLLGGAMLGAATGVLATYWGASFSLKKMSDEQAKQLLIKNRNQTMAWIVVSGLLLTASYEFTVGWLMPVMSYCLFAVVLFGLVNHSWKIIDRELYSDTKNRKVSRKKRVQIYCRVVGTIIGLCGGFLGLYIGLLNVGRL
jgi:RNA polymerase sigma factor (sigma-70 family)